MRATVSLLLAACLAAACGRPAEAGAGSPEPRPAASMAAGDSAVSAAFAAHGATGTMVIRRLPDGHEWVHNTVRADSAFLPASTFKIAHAAIALETGVAGGPDDHFAWDGVERWHAPWNRDHTLKSAMAASAVPVFQQIARAIGPARMSEWLQRIDYGNADISGGIDQFWLTGGLRTSAREQVDFLTRFITGATAFSPRTVDVVADLLLVEQRPGWTLHAKSGWADETAVGWWAGWSRIDGDVYVFALNMVMNDVASAPKRIDIARDALTAVGAIPVTR